LAAAAVPTPALADLWSFDSSVETKLELNDNIALSSKPAGSVTTVAVVFQRGRAPHRERGHALER
jgi:hypothetical protein